MLVLSRKSGEKIVVGKSVEITVTQIGRGRVRLGIAAPDEICIRRGEIPEMTGGRKGKADQNMKPVVHR